MPKLDNSMNLEPKAMFDVAWDFKTNISNLLREQFVRECTFATEKLRPPRLLSLLRQNFGKFSILQEHEKVFT